MYYVTYPSMLLKLKYCLNTFNSVFVFVSIFQIVAFLLNNIIDYICSIIKEYINVQ